MLNFNTVTTGSELAAVLTTQGIQVAPKGGSFLSKLNQTLLGAGLGNLTGIIEDPNKEMDAGWVSMLVEHSQAGLPDGTPSEYQATFDLLAEELANSVSGTIDFARNTVNPVIKHICTKLADTLDAAGQGGSFATTGNGVRFTMSNGGVVVNILEEGPDMLYLDAVTEGEASARMQVPFKEVKSPVVFPEMTSVQLMEMMEESGASGFVKDVANTLKAREDGYEILLDAYNQAFFYEPGRPKGVMSNAYNGDMSLYPLVILALSSVLFEDFPDGTIGSANDIKNALGDFSTQLKSIVATNIEVYKRALADKKIVTYHYNENYQTNVHVNKESYRSYLEDGGTTEALIGCCFDDKDFDYENLLANLQRYEGVYARRVAEAAAYNESNRLTIFRNTLRDAVYDEIFECEEGAIRPVPHAEARQALDELMKTVYVDALDRPYETVRSVVCKSLFAGTDAEEILVNIDNICEKNENLSVRDASALVVLDYVTKYLVCQMDIKRSQ